MYDLECLLDGVEAILKAQLNAQIAAIEAEKIAGGYPATDVQPVDTDAYHRQTWSDKILNMAPAIFYGVEDIQTVGLGPATAEEIKIFVEVVTVDSGMDDLGGRRLMRYSRAVKQVLEKNWDKIAPGKCKVSQIRPLNFPVDSNTSEEIKVGGVSVITSIA